MVDIDPSAPVDAIKTDTCRRPEYGVELSTAVVGRNEHDLGRLDPERLHKPPDSVSGLEVERHGAGVQWWRKAPAARAPYEGRHRERRSYSHILLRRVLAQALELPD
jgi:hypothetical protein